MLDDKELIINFKQGDRSALEILFGRYLQPIFNFINRALSNSEEAEDLTQIVFLKAWKNLKHFDLEKNFRTWLFAIARNTLIDFYKKKKHIPFSCFEGDTDTPGFSETIADLEPLILEKLKKQESVTELEKILKQLSPEERMELLLHYDEDLTFREIADIDKQSLDTVKSRHRRALIKLRNLLK